MLEKLLIGAIFSLTVILLFVTTSNSVEASTGNEDHSHLSETQHDHVHDNASVNFTSSKVLEEVVTPFAIPHNWVYQGYSHDVSTGDCLNDPACQIVYEYTYKRYWCDPHSHEKLVYVGVTSSHTISSHN
jgi:hypothetical protein